MTPKRIRMSRQHPWRPDNPDAVIVARPSKFGNPFVIRGKSVMLRGVTQWIEFVIRPGTDHALRAAATESYRKWLLGKYPGAVIIADQRWAILDNLQSLAGKDLACWCPLDDGRGNRVPCHADVLLELANPGWKP